MRIHQPIDQEDQEHQEGGIPSASSVSAAFSLLTEVEGPLLVEQYISYLQGKGSEQSIVTEPQEPAQAKCRAGQEYEFRRNGPLWSVAFAGNNNQLAHLHGFDVLHRLLSNPDMPLDVRQLDSGEGVAVITEPVADQIMSNEAKATISARITELQEEREEAEANNDQASEQRADNELEKLQLYIKNNTGLNGMSRNMPTEREKCRDRVRKNLRKALWRIGEWLPALHKHLEASIRGRSSYRPCYSPKTGLPWVLR